MSFWRLVLRNVAVRPLRAGLTAVAVAIGVVAAVTLSLVNHSIRTSAIAILETGQADFTVSQRGVADLLNSNIDESDLPAIRALPGVADATGALIGTTSLNSANPLFLEVGIAPDQLGVFGVTLLDGKPYAADAQDQLLLGYRAAKNLGKRTGDRIAVGDRTFTIAGLYRTGQALGDTGAMFPLTTFQAMQRQAGEVTLVFVRVRPGSDVAAVKAAVERDNPQLVSIQTLAEFGRADRSLQLIDAADKGSTLLAIGIGAVIVMTTLMMTFLERLREFGILGAVGWGRGRILALVLSEASVIALAGAMIGTGLTFVATLILPHVSGLRGILHVDYTAAAFGRALLISAAMVTLGALYPGLRAAFMAPSRALRHE